MASEQTLHHGWLVGPPPQHSQEDRASSVLPEEGSLEGFTIGFPELLAGFAQKQWISARASVTELSEYLSKKHPDADIVWTLRHAFYADMGGFLLAAPDYPAFPVNAMQIGYLVREGYMNPPIVDTQIIWDKNKADGFARVLKSLQVVWFATQCIARVAKGLPLSTFELDTVTFVLCTLPTYYFWVHKPLDASTTIALKLKDGIHIRDVLTQASDCRAATPFKSTPLDFVLPKADPYDLLDPIMWGLDVLFGIDDDAKHGPISTFRNGSRRLTSSRMRAMDCTVLIFITMLTVSTHMLAWNFHFPTEVERTLWRVASSTLLGFTFCYAVIVLSLQWAFVPLLADTKRCRNIRTVTEGLVRLHPVAQYAMAILLGGPYALARAYLLVEALVGLRAIPIKIFQTVEWTDFLPHI